MVAILYQINAFIERFFLVSSLVRELVYLNTKRKIVFQAMEIGQIAFMVQVKKDYLRPDIWPAVISFSLQVP